ncbi:MAG: hypothetical protein ACREGR_00285 [Minisyncoccia bacterium]
MAKHKIRQRDVNKDAGGQEWHGSVFCSCGWMRPVYAQVSSEVAHEALQAAFQEHAENFGGDAP